MGHSLEPSTVMREGVKYKMTDETTVAGGKVLHRIEALADITLTGSMGVSRQETREGSSSQRRT